MYNIRKSPPPKKKKSNTRKAEQMLGTTRLLRKNKLRKSVYALVAQTKVEKIADFSFYVYMNS